jgi:carboxymethylenebutenolidase
MNDLRGRDVHIPEPNGGGAFAAIPSGATRGAVVIHEIFGRAPEIDRVVERFARQGYAAVGPDLFHGRSALRCIRAAMRAIHSGQGPAIDQILRARAWLCDETGIREEHVGLIGFCIGGGFALAAGRGWGAVSTNYGDVPSTEVLRGVGPVIGCYGGRDRMFRGAGERLRKRIADAGARPPEVHTYPDAGHSFLTDGHHPIAAALSYPLMHMKYDPVAADDAWDKIFAFFGQHLGSA